MSGFDHLFKEIGIWIVGCGMVFFGIFFAEDIAHFAKPYAEQAVRSANKAVDGAMPGEASHSGSQTSRENGRRRVFLSADRYNQFYADARINGTRTRVLVDTGASHVSLRYEDAEDAGIYLDETDFTHSSRTANGIARVAPITIDEIRIGDIVVRDVPGLVGEPGKKFSTLLGMAFLGRLERVSFSGRRLELEQ